MEANGRGMNVPNAGDSLGFDGTLRLNCSVYVTLSSTSLKEEDGANTVFPSDCVQAGKTGRKRMRYLHLVAANRGNTARL